MVKLEDYFRHTNKKINKTNFLRKNLRKEVAAKARYSLCGVHQRCKCFDKIRDVLDTMIST